MTAIPEPAHEEADPLLTTAEVAALLGVGPPTWRGYVSRGTAPAPDDPDLGRPPARRTPRWRRSTVEAWAATRRTPGGTGGGVLGKAAQ
ncbi:helix-turn-helix transcriptional regulator, partial [Parafrankia sp. FMc2]|uniref:helix-turn-helix transcriptional regulator n=1 Tax=Parafrankia sp. FMc2 TaxID=3233196 RepID=UPI0034D48BB9